MPLYLGIDGGGSKTAAVILDESEREIGRGSGGPCNIATCEDDVLRDSILSATHAALESARLPSETRFTGVCAGVAGFTARSRREAFSHLLAGTIPADSHHLEPDYVIAYWGATEGEPGVAVIAGTGAVTYGRNAAGDSCRIDGRGFLLGDDGSGFQIGRNALIHTLRRLEQNQTDDRMTKELFRAMDGVGKDDLIEWTYRGFDPARIAVLSEAVKRAADADDGIAANLLSDAGHTLRHAALSAMEQLHLPIDSPVYRVGGLWKLGNPLISAFERGIPDRMPPDAALNIQQPKHDSATGAALLARQAGT